MSKQGALEQSAADAEPSPDPLKSTRVFRLTLDLAPVQDGWERTTLQAAVSACALDPLLANTVRVRAWGQQSWPPRLPAGAVNGKLP